MGPPIYIGGNYSYYRDPDPQRSCFNGATDLHRWKLLLVGRISQPPELLQWGHRFTSVETFTRLADPALKASLQWGHRFTSVETISQRLDIYETSDASMGPPIYIGGNNEKAIDRLAHRQASMGPPIYIGGN